MEAIQKIDRGSPRIGEIAPDFRARSTGGEIQLSKLRGRWVIFFSHPADFTPVCSTEFAELARRQAEFDALETSLLGLSVDSLYSHLAWIRAIRETLGADVRFPIIEDPSMAIGRAYGMIDERSADSMAMRSTFFIDPEGVIKAITCYPYNVGRSVDEMLRMLKALQAVDGGEVLAPEGWREGKPLLSPLSDTAENHQDWFCRFVGAG
ncbi:peroxiredoxin [Sphingomonas colocasiae]|uniref:Alkyl hydroperoxide reductase C n=1 Tax=Sphingomonas colocasiae TaxID=1848973 RepID=A0ABS7PPX2_9SPHN|nr:peroxiredoxin [Sphingomonas colocasiae]MBY8823376.1 peroxiredoxin [Sphingomonas colocasiae]